MTDKIIITGLRPLQAALKELPGKWPRELRIASKDAATIIGEGTKAAFAAGPGSSVLAAASVKVLAGQRDASIRIGGNDRGGRVALGNEFGSIRFKQFPAWRGVGADAGYALYPTIRAKRAEVVEAYGAALDRLLHDAFPD
jgi:hypothetical protein